tara:strand:+ start:1045 stop:2073 length:1029 start_codon:yes stop_codon:yes gene_type:complete
MAQTLYLPIQQVFTDLGLIGAGFKLETFKTGTSTPLATYSDTALTIANANPTIADSAGRFPQIFINDAKLYKAVLKDAEDNVVWTADPIDPKIFTLNDFDPRPTSFWGVTDGTSTVYTLAANPAITAYSSNQTFFLQFHIACGIAPTIAISELSALALKKSDGAGGKVDLEINDVLTGTYEARNDGTDIVILNPEKPFFDSRNLSRATELLAGVTPIASQAKVIAGVEAGEYVAPSTLGGLFNNSILANSAKLLTKVGGAFNEAIIKYERKASLPSSGTIIFPEAFPTACISVMIVAQDSVGIFRGAQLTSIPLTTGFNYNTLNSNGNSATADAVYYQAIGY